MKLRNTESVWRVANSQGWVAEIRGLFDDNKGYHDWIRLGVFETREAAEQAILKSRDGSE